MPLSQQRLARIRGRLEVVTQIRPPSLNPGGLVLPEQRIAARESLNAIKGFLNAMLTALENAPGLADPSLDSLQASVDHLAAAFQSAVSMFEALGSLQRPPGGITFSAGQLATIEAQLLALRDAALAEVALA